MALPVYAEVDLLPDVPDEVELLEGEPGTAPEKDTIEQLPDANAPPEQEADAEQDAATPEPEQSAGPEQPAPTETPEPTAEPTPTPEPAATATATPVPTVTPTATPEPTEQPQKMYAARSVGNVQAVSAGENTETHTLYFAVPSGWKDYTKVKIYAIVGKNGNGDKKYYLEMQVADETEDGRKIYSAVLNKDDHYPYNGLGGLEFRGYENDAIADNEPTSTITIVQVDNNNQLQDMSFNPTASNYIGGNYYDGNQGDGNQGSGWDQKKWKDYTVGHKHFADKEMAFENKTSETLTNVKAWFYEPDTNKTLTPVSEQPISLNDIQPNSTAKVTIPSDLCSYVQFTWDEGGSHKSSKIYNFYGESVSDDKESFTYSDTSNCFIYTGANNERWGIENSVLIYYDATFSKMALNGDTGDYSIPKANQSTVYYRLKGNGKESIDGTMSRIEGTDYYAADVPEGYTKIVFSSYRLTDDNNLAGCGDSTGWETIPTDYKVTEQCFYADTNDDAVYSNGTRGGYWAPKYTKRDAETWKNAGKVVDIASADFTEEPDTKYVTSTLYDYYTDYELNGNNRDRYSSTYYTPGKTGGFASQRSWVTFRQFDRALSDYYESCKALFPIYTGHFQPSYSDWGITFESISAALNLWGFKNSNYENYKRFMAINNSTINESGNGEFYDYAYQGLVEDKTSTGDATGEPLLKGTKIVEPHFNEEFLSGTNTKNPKLGNVYNNVAFPFTKKQIFDNDTGVEYWYFDSQDTTLYLKQDSTTKQYFLKSSKDKREQSCNLDSTSTKKTISKSGKTVNSYGYFPFNETATEERASTYNYGFGTKLQMDFTLTDNGMVETKKMDSDGNPISTNIKFFFSGDDDVWVFIDGQLALDVGGAHGKVSGLLEFGATEDGKNSVTAYVSKVKKGGTSENDQDGNPVKTVTYNGESISFSAQNTSLKPLDKGKKHTLTMYYMERGMWESNMAVAFNFPDNNELQVQKEVDLTNVTDTDFRNCFKNQKIFNFTIQNQATHYGEKKAADPDTSGTPSQEVDLEASTIEPATPGNDAYIFRLDANPGPDSGTNTEKVLHWYARYQDTEPVSDNRDKRYGILTLNQPINIKDERFLTFEVYVDSKDGGGGKLSLNNLYLELLDEQKPIPGQKGSLGTSGINGATYGSVNVKPDKWVTVKLDLNKMKEQDGSNGKFSGNVTTIRVGDNYSRHIYFRNFTFIPKAKPSTMSGFTTDQKDIPDYGSATSGHLENAENAQYTSTKDKDTQLVDGNGRFVLEDGETVTFSDQFRRGSYISLKEKLNKNLYDTTWTVYENGQAVTSTNPDDTLNVKTVTFGENRSLEKQKDPTKGPDDGRTEKMGTGEEQPEENEYNETKPSDANTIVFRSYKDPDETSSTLTKLKVKYVNKVKTGGLKIQKKAAAGEENSIKGTYKFKVTFNDVGGEGLEKEPIIKYVEINMNDTSDHTGTITGIPVGTRYTIEEVTPEDQSRLQSVTVPKGQSAHVINNNTMVEGVIVESEDPNNLEVTAIFTNTQRTLINIKFDKLWRDADNKELKNQPSEIYIQLQRRLETSMSDDDWQAVEYAGSNYVTITHRDKGWTSTFSGLDQYQINDDSNHTNYEYRIVEGTVDDTTGTFTEVKPNETITIKGNTYVVTAKATPSSETNSAGSSTGNTATAKDGTITGGSGTIVLTNTLQNPKFVLDIIKKDAEKDNSGNDVPLSGVEFKLEKLKVKTTTEGEPQVDNTYTFSNGNTGSITATTNDSGKITNVFKDLEPGTYRLTETKAHAGYNLLSKPIDITFEDGKCSIDGVEVPEDDDTFTPTPGTNNTYTMTLTVLNRKTPELPHTGADAPSLWLLIGLPLAVAGLLIFTFRYNRKGGRRH